MELTDEQAALLEPLAATAATITYRRVSDGLSWNDLKATALLWAVAHPRKALEWLGHEDEKQGGKLILTSMCNATMRATLKERADRIGYRVSDLAWYTVEQIREEILPCLWDKAMWANPPVRDRGEARGSSLPSERGGWMAMLADVADAYRKLSGEQQQLLIQKYGLQWTTEEMAAQCGQTEEQVSQALSRAIRAIHHKLGGDRPQGCPAGCECGAGPLVVPRQSTNGQRLAELEQGYEG